VGRNGAGKSSLFAVLSGSLHEGGGEFSIPPQWRITHIGKQPVNAATAATISFLANNGIAGSTGCNRFFGQYTLAGETLSFKGMGSTRMAYSAELMAQESAFLKALESVNRFSFHTGRRRGVQARQPESRGAFA